MIAHVKFMNCSGALIVNIFENLWLIDHIQLYRGNVIGQFLVLYIIVAMRYDPKEVR